VEVKAEELSLVLPLTEQAPAVKEQALAAEKPALGLPLAEEAKGPEPPAEGPAQALALLAKQRAAGLALVRRSRARASPAPAPLRPAERRASG
jgi:hypothetical protein